MFHIKSFIGKERIGTTAIFNKSRACSHTYGIELLVATINLINSIHIEVSQSQRDIGFHSARRREYSPHRTKVSEALLKNISAQCKH